MFETFRNAWKVQDLRKKILYTLLIIFIFRIGSAIPVPYLDPSVMKDLFAANSGSFLGWLDMMTGGAFARSTLFAMSITPYINAQIIMQLLTIAISPLERMAKEGEEGKRRLNKITRYAALFIALIQSTAYYFTLRNSGAVAYTDGFSGVMTAIVIILCFTAGASLIIWLGERINEKGIGNGISMILFASIVARGSNILSTIVQIVKGDAKYYLIVPIIAAIFVVIIGFIVLMTNAERRIPVQYAKRVVGRKMYGGQSSHIPIKLGMTGVMPIIFASAFLSLPATFAMFFPPTSGSAWDHVVKFLSPNNWFYAILYFLLILGFNYFYTAIQYNPLEIANNLRKNNGAIPGIRPGKPTSDYIAKIISKITLFGAVFLGIIAIFPIFFTKILNDPQLSSLAFGGTSVLIVVGVALETVRSLESQMMMRHHKGFLE